MTDSEVAEIIKGAISKYKERSRKITEEALVYISRIQKECQHDFEKVGIDWRCKKCGSYNTSSTDWPARPSGRD